MRSNALASACLAAVALTAGCSDEYGHERLDAQSPEFRAVQAMLDKLRNAGADELDDVIVEQLPNELDAAQIEGLRRVLTQLAQADTATLLQADRWGGDWYRATIAYADKDGDHTIALLLYGDDDTFYWAKTN
ncbi:MAG: hypothetical protein ISS78_11955 [Phycisphaerae bacterium]|nr:hypothetical protein [Phycisphaerae bacterium]